MKIQLWFRVTSLLVFLQIALGGLLTFSFITALPHIITGFAVLAFAIVALVMAQRLKPAFRPLQGLSVGLVLLIVVQIVLGFTTLSTGNQVVAWVHLLVAMGIYGMVIAGTFMSMRLDYRSREPPSTGAGLKA
jgi:heme A synthase